jgi:hypothetical protein
VDEFRDIHCGVIVDCSCLVYETVQNSRLWWELWYALWNTSVDLQISHIAGKFLKTHALLALKKKRHHCSIFIKEPLRSSLN